MVEVNKDDLEVIRELEREIGKKIPKVDVLEQDETGYQVNDTGRVEGVSIFNSGISGYNISTLQQLSSLRKLLLVANQLTTLPEGFKELKQLTSLDLSGNQLTTLPEGFKELKQLTTLYLSSNKLTTLPEGFKELKQLTSLYLRSNQLTTLPEGFKELKQLTSLDLSGNQLTTLPEGFKELKQLTTLYLSSNKLTTLPEGFKELKQLTTLDLSSNILAALPEGIENLINLNEFDLDNNPDIDIPASVIKNGVRSILKYLKEKHKNAITKYEGKLLILGDGEEGKTCISRALRGLKFSDQKTTRGVNVIPWKFKHPTDRDINITLNLWDFEGQEINHQTHQFFLATQSLYILVFKCREIFRMDRAEYWLDTIRARAPKSKVLIVLTQCEKRMPSIPLDKLKSNYPDLLQGDIEDWYFITGCKNGKGIKELRNKIQLYASQMKCMGYPWPKTYQDAEIEIKRLCKKESHITRDVLYRLFKEAGTSPDNFENTADTMGQLGLITQFKDSEELRSFIVLQPQWLTKAISWIMEDSQLYTDQGDIAFSRMRNIWDQKKYTNMFSDFHNCMKEFELCYDMEDNKRKCLVPLRFWSIAPEEIPWTQLEGYKERVVEYKLNIRPPYGLMSRFIVKTHHMIVQHKGKGVYWLNGVFLASGEDELRSEALCTFNPEERTLRIQVRAVFPQAFQEQLHGILKSVFSFYEGIEPERRYGCLDIIDGKEFVCPGVHSEKRLNDAIKDKNPRLDCSAQRKVHYFDPKNIIYGFSSFGEYITKEDIKGIVKGEIRNIEKDLMTCLVLLDRVDTQQKQLPAEIFLKINLCLHNYLNYFNQMLDDRDFTSAPGIIGFVPKDGSKFNPKKWFEKEYILTPYCEYNGEIHRCEDAQATFTIRRKWWENASPWATRILYLFYTGLTAASALSGNAAATITLVAGQTAYEALKHEVEYMKDFSEYLKLSGKTPVFESFYSKFTQDKGLSKDSDRITRIQLATLMEEIAPVNYKARQWGSLQRVRMPDDTYRWLCHKHAKMVKR